MEKLDLNKEIDIQIRRVKEVYYKLDDMLVTPPDDEEVFREQMEEILKEANHRYIDLVSFAGAAHAQLFGE